MLKPLFLASLAYASLHASCGESARPSAGPPATVETTTATGPRGGGDVSEGGPSRPRPREIAARHVLVMHRDSSRVPPGITRSRAEARARAEEVLRRARAGEDLGTLAREFTDEPGGGERGGSLGRFRRGNMVRAFEEAAFALEVDGLSDVVETDFGFHVIQRTE